LGEESEARLQKNEERRSIHGWRENPMFWRKSDSSGRFVTQRVNSVNEAEAVEYGIIDDEGK